MASKAIKGINFQIGGDTRELNQALKNVEKEAVKTQRELKEVEKASKIDPSSTELYAQKQQLLQKQVSNTADKLDVLKKAQAQVEQQFKNGKIGEEQYRAFQRELVMTEQALKSYQGKIEQTRTEHHALAESTKNMETFFKATGTQVNTFADVLGSKLANAIKEGKANSQQLNQALEKMGKTALGSSTDIEKMKHALANVDQKGIKQVQKELGQVAKEAKNAGDEVNGFGNKLQSVAGALMAGGGIAALIHEALDVSSLNTNIEISMGIKGGDVEAVRSSINSVTAAIGDEEAAYEGVRRQMTLNKDASQATNDKIIQGAAMVSRAYKEIDFKELIQESHEIGKEMGISQQEALALTNQLLSIGFPTEQLDIISEYGQQLKRAGFNAEEIQAIMAAGVETGTWNIDNLLDGLKEGRIRAAEFGTGLSQAQKDAIKDAGLSQKAFEDWGNAIAKGGEDGNAAFREMTQALADVDDQTARNALGVEIFGTKFEDQGDNIIDTVLNMENHLKSAGDMQNKLNGDVEKMKADPAYRLAEAMNSVKQSLAPVMADIAEVVASIADWVAENPKLTASLVAIVAVIGTLVGAFAAFMPAIGSLVGMFGGASAAAGVLGTVIAGISAPIAIAVGAIAGIGIGLYALNENMKESTLAVDDWRDNVSEGTAKVVGDFLDLETQATNSLNQLRWSGGTVTKEMASEMIETYANMNNQILEAQKEKNAQELQTMTDHFATSNALSDAEEAEILAKMQENNAKQEEETANGQKRIAEILTNASNEKRAITEAEAQEIGTIQAKMKENGIKYLSESERDQKVIFENLKRNASEKTAQQAADVVKNSKKQRDETIKDAKKQHDETVKEIQRQRDETGTISAEQAKKLIDEADKQLQATTKSANAMHNNVVKEAKAQAKEHVNEVDWETGEVLTKWDKFKQGLGKVWDGITKGVSTALSATGKAASSAWDGIVKIFSGALDKIKGFFKGLSFKMPKIEMPPMPHFSITGKFSLNPPSIPKIGVDWYAKGGLMTKPTAFGMNGSNLMVGGEVPGVSEAILPLTPQVLGGIGKGIAQQMGAGQAQTIIIQPQPINLDGHTIAYATYDSVSSLQQGKAQIKAHSKGVNLY